MMKSLTALVLTAATISSVAVSRDKVDFSCHDVKSMIELLEDGPEDVVKQVADDPVDYRDNHHIGVDVRNDAPSANAQRNNLPSELGLLYGQRPKHVTDDDFATAGESFKRGLGAFYDCFGKELLTETPVSYTRTSRGEGIIGILKDTYKGRHIIVQYGYFWDSAHATPIVWQTIVGYGQSE